MKRHPHETYEEYQKRRKAIQTARKHKMKGTLLWNSHQRGTFRYS